MKKIIIALIITIIFSALAFFLTDMIWPAEEAAVKPIGDQILFFKIVSILESVLFGLGFAFFYLTFPTFKKNFRTRNWKNILTILAITWMFLNWWPHDNMHLFFGSVMEQLIFIEGFFHGSMILAVLVVAYSYYSTMKDTNQELVR